MRPDATFWCGRRVFVTGHTGFKGGWLTLWLSSLGAVVYGYALEPAAGPCLFQAASVGETVATTTFADIRDRGALAAAVRAAAPEVVFHLAAQPLVRESYADPTTTYETNVMGVVNLLEAVRTSTSIKAVINVTSDKCYRNREQVHGYGEDEPMGGRDPYSSSKACAELITATYRDSFLAQADVGVATVRAGNVIGGGDWAQDRLVPDVFRAIDAEQPLLVRYPNAVRPWQHVLEPLTGYVCLAERLHKNASAFAGAWNFGPDGKDEQTVGWIVDRLTRNHPRLIWEPNGSAQPHEAGLLKLDSTKAHTRLGWRPRWDLERALDKTSQWHAAWKSAADMHAFTLGQIREYVGG